MTLHSVPDLVPAADEVIVDVRAANVGFVDTLVVSGSYQTIPPVPFTPGMEFAGVVRSVGASISNHKVGDRIVAYTPHGAFAEQAAVKLGHFYPIPDDVPFMEAALLCGSYLTAYLAIVERGKLGPGETVLVGGASGAVGHAAIELSKAKGARVVAAVRSEKDAELAGRAGADATIFADRDNLRDAVREQVFDRTAGKGVNLVIDPIGGDFLSGALRSLAWNGRLVVVGFASGTIASIKTNYLLLKNISILGLDLTQYRSRAIGLLEDAQAEIFKLWRRGLLKPLVARQFSFEEVPQALDFVSRGSTSGRAVITMTQSRPEESKVLAIDIQRSDRPAQTRTAG